MERNHCEFCGLHLYRVLNMKSAAYIFTINVNKLTLIADIIINRDLYQRE